MKRITFLFLINILLVTAGCKTSSTSPLPHWTEGEFYFMGKDIYDAIISYYYIYSQYPESVDDLVEYMKIIDTSYQPLYDDAHIYFKLYKDAITITIENNHFTFNDTVNETRIDLELDNCVAKRKPLENSHFRSMHYRYVSFDFAGNYIWDINDVIAYGIDAVLKDLFQREVMIEVDGEMIPRYIYFHYDRKGNITPLCDEDKDIISENDPYIMTLLELLDKYIFSNKKVYSVKVLQVLREMY